MRVTEHEIAALLLGVAIGSLITYWNLTREKRLVASIRSDIDTLGSYHNLTPGQYRQGMGLTALVTDDEIIALHNWAQLIKASGEKVSPTWLAAEAVICEKLLGLSRFDALQASRNVKNMDDLGAYLDSLRAPRSKKSN